MTKWLISGVVVAGAVVVVCYFGTPNPIPSAVAPAEVTATAANLTPLPSPTATLASVVDVTDIDPFLDPPMIPVSEPSTTVGPIHIAVGYEEASPVPVTPTVAVMPIPPAVEDEETAVPVAPMPREVGHVATECGPVSGPILLDMAAASLVPDETVMSAYQVFNDFDHFIITASLPCQSIAKATPLAPLFALTDSHLLQQRTEGSATSPPRQTLVLVPGSVVRADIVSATVRRISALGHVGAQAPATRSEWYTRWYGDTRVPQQAETQQAPKEIWDSVPDPQRRDKAVDERVDERKSPRGIGIGVGRAG